VLSAKETTTVGDIELGLFFLKDGKGDGTNGEAAPLAAAPVG
jgi:hypothetical protein